MDGNRSERAQRIGRLCAAAAESEQVARDDRVARNSALRAENNAGTTLRELATWSGLSISTVARVIARPD